MTGKGQSLHPWLLPERTSQFANCNYFVIFHSLPHSKPIPDGN
jgi:hypothetical protein